MTEETLPQWKKKELLKLFEAAITTRLDETDANLNFFNFMRKIEKLELNTLSPKKEAKLEAKYKKLGKAMESALEETEQVVQKAKAKALAKGLTEAEISDVESVVVGFDKENLKDVFTKANLSKDLVKRMKQQDKKIVAAGEEPIYAAFYAK